MRSLEERLNRAEARMSIAETEARRKDSELARVKEDELRRYLAVCCSIVQCVAVCCSVLQCVAVRCSVLHMSAAETEACRKDSERARNKNHELQRCVAVYFRVLQCVAHVSS